jgi:pimeloyl-ACP methyl ester carboxylesterase
MSNPQVKRSEPPPAVSPARARLLEAVPLTEQRWALAGIPTAVLVGGEGPPMILLHGPGEFALVWLRLFPDLVRAHRVIVPDLPGHGASGLGELPLGRDRVLTWLDELIDRACSAPPVLVGHLMGGAIAARYALDHGERLREIVLVDTLGLRRFRPSPTFALTMLAFLARPSERSRDRFFRQCFVDWNSLPAQLGELWQPLMAYALEQARSADQKAAVRVLLRHFGSGPIPDEELARISVPTSLVWGRHDRQTPVTVAEKAGSRYGWPLHIIEGAADDPAFEQPDALVKALATTP